MDEVDGLFEKGVVVLAGSIDLNAATELGAAERALVARAVDKRRNEFATVRALARRALARFDVASCEILHDADGVPVWPVGMAGSLSHCDTRGFAALGRSDEVGSLGIDAEDLRPLPHDLWPLVLRPDELRDLEALPVDERGRAALVIFSAKESLYKAQYPRSRVFLEYSDVRVDQLEIGRTAGRFRCSLQREASPFPSGSAFTGRFRELDAVIVTAIQIR